MLLQTPVWCLFLFVSDIFLTEDLSASVCLAAIFAVPNLIEYADKLAKCWRCPVCREYITLDEQTSHRYICYLRNKKSIFRRLPRSQSSICPHCGQRLYLWPEKYGQRFKCLSGFHGGNGILVKSDGGNRFACFACGYDICLKCEVRPTAPPLVMDTVIMQFDNGENHTNRSEYQTMLINDDLIVSII